ncbi:MAG: ATP-dependent DNA helicase UvrD2 [Actinomycetota bacterium]|nr:ATP-dependent DNA helicase UvrD2 [Actinomycetota bacterium]
MEPEPPVPLAALLAGLNEAQREAVTTEAAPLCILAGAGSGKTRVLTRRIAYQVATGRVDPRHVLAVTFTRRAAGELSSRLEALGVREHVAAGTFHSLAYAQLRRHWADRGLRAPALLQSKLRLLTPLMPPRRHTATGEPWASVPQPSDVAVEIEWAKARLIAPGRYEAEAEAAGRRPPLALAAVAALFERYEEEKRRKRLVDFDDLLLLCARALESDREFAAAQRWRFRHLFVDEFQDVNRAQFRLLEAWRGDRADVCVVGDPNQAIYAWNGADSSYLTGFTGRFPGAGVVRLDENYRSSPQVLAVANAVIGGRHRLRAHEPDGPLPTVTSFPTDREEAVGVARAVRRRYGSGKPWSDVAILTRTNAQLVLFEEAMRAAGIPYRLRGSSRFLSHPDVRAALDELRRLPPVTPLANTVPDLLAAARDAAAVTAGADERAQHLESLARLAREHVAAEPDATVAGFHAWLVATLRGDDPDTGGDAVDLATLHAAKGLEWPVVFLCGLEQGLLPIGHAESAEAKAEERRLLYVACTRARRELHCSWAERRTFGDRDQARSPSPYLETIEAAILALQEGRPVADWREHLAAGRAKVKAAAGQPGPPRAGSNADPRVLEALKSWRAATAKETGVPAYVVFHDTTLAAVAEAKPRDRSALLALPGMGQVKVDRYGDALLSLLAAEG